MATRFLRSIRLLAECYQAFELKSGRHVRTLGVTPAQFDVIATLGRTEGMNFTELAAKTLITKGTLSGVIDRMQAKRLVVREPIEGDGRRVLVRLTHEGERLFDRIFPLHIAYLEQGFADFSGLELDRFDEQLRRVRDALR
jgi:MarR family transcriptional regulator, 2-MHQ and catechol-resistance regulon repressor